MIARTSIISLVQKPLNITRDELNIVDGTKYIDHDINCMYNDLAKTFLRFMSDDVNYLIIDLYFDVLFGVLISEYGIITNNHWNLPHTKFYQNMVEKKKF